MGLQCYVKDVKVKLQSGSTDNTLVATWTFTPPKGFAKSTLDHFGTNWYYVNADGIAYEGGYKETTNTYTTFTLPKDAYYVDFHIVPSSKKVKDKNGNEQYQWCSATKVVRYKNTYVEPTGDVSTPTVKMNKLTLTASLTNIDTSNIKRVEFQVAKDDIPYKSGKTSISATNSATFTTTVEQGSAYKVRARGISAGGVVGDWSDFSDAVITIPRAPSKFTKCCMADKNGTSVALSWKAVTGEAGATGYTIEYTDARTYFDAASSDIKSVTTTSTDYIVTGLDTGKTWFFRVKATNDQGDSSWSAISSCTLGVTPDMPTTWSGSSTAITGENVYLYWVHNCEDESTCTSSQLELSTDAGANWKRTTIANTNSATGTLSYLLTTSSYTEGSTILWRVRTAGITSAYGDWSVVRSVSVYAKPSVNLVLVDSAGSTVDMLSTYPLVVSASTSPSTQTPVTYNLEIVAQAGYIINDQVGEPVNVSKGDIVFSETTAHESGVSYQRTITPGDITFANGYSYEVKLTVAFDSGLTATDSETFDCIFDDAEIELGAAVAYDETNYTAYVTPEIYSDDTDWTLAVYRREYDGSFKLIQGDLSGAETVTVTDPHPALDYARYRITATNNTNGTVEYADLPNVTVGCKWLIIQWDEAWKTFSADALSAEVDPPWSGSLLLLKYNPQTSYDTTTKVETVEYAGREYPVAYYGKYKETSVSWKTDVVRDDTDTIFQLRRLQAYAGNCYVRDPSGFGCWANVSISFDRDYDSAVIPVNVSITRVDDGGQP